MSNIEIKNVILTAVEEVRDAIDAANKEFISKKTKVDYPTRVEVEFGITSAYSVANYDDVRIATVRVSIPVFHQNGAQGAQIESSPATAAIAGEAGKKAEPAEKVEKPAKKNGKHSK